MAWPSSIGRTTDPGSRTTRLGRETRCSYRMAAVQPGGRAIFTAPAGMHGHFPLWSPDAAFIYFVQGSLPDKLDIWRIAPGGGRPERITSHNGRVSHPVFLNPRTLMYLASDPDGSGPWLYSMDVERRIPHRLTSGPDRYTSLAASADGRRLVVTLARPKRTLWRLRLGDSPADVSAAAQIPLTTSTGFSPRLGPDYLLYISATGASESIWKLVSGTGTELWSGQGAQIFGGPAISPDGRHIAFSVRRNRKDALVRDAGRRHERADSGRFARSCRGLRHGRPMASRSPQRQTIMVSRISSAFRSTGVPPLLLSRSTRLIPRGLPDGRLVVYSGPDIGTTFSVKAVTADAAAHPCRPSP